MKWSLLDTEDETIKEIPRGDHTGDSTPAVIPAHEPESSASSPNSWIPGQARNDNEPSVFANEVKQSSENADNDLGVKPLNQEPARISLLSHFSFTFLIIAIVSGALAGAGYYFRDSALADTVINTYLDHQIESGLVGHWTFDGGDITGTSTVLDRSNSHATGTMTNMATSSRAAGKMGQALQFDGTNKHVVVNSTLGLTNTNFSIAGWAYVSNTTNHGAFIKIGNNVSEGDGFGIGIGGAGLTGFETTGNRLLVLYEYMRWIDTGKNFGTGWHHFVLTVNSSGYPTVYLDGVNVYSDTGTSARSPGSTGSADTRIGGYTSSLPSNRYFNGTLDDVRIYNRVLSQKEIKRLYKLGEGVKVNSSPNTVVDDGLVGHWTFDGQNMSGNSAYDLSSTHATGTLTNMASSSRVGGKHGQALNFDGVDDYIDAGSLSALDNLSAITTSVWVNAYGYGESTAGQILNKGTGSNGALNGWLVRLNGQSIDFQVSYSSGSSNVKRGGNNQFDASYLRSWHHIVVTWDGSTSYSGIHIYLDGQEITYAGFSEQNAFGGRDNDASNILRIGNSQALSRTFEGLIDDVRIYNRALSADEIAKLYSAGQGIRVNADAYVPPFVCGTDTVTDADGNVYNTVKIGTQCWMKQNMRVGTRINVATTQTNNSTIEKYCYDDTDANCTDNHPNYPDGGLYQWNEAMQYSTTSGARGICPAGWHIPTHDEFTTLERAICTSGSCATDFPYDTTTNSWRGTNEGTKLKPNGTSGFEANLVGYIVSGSFVNRLAYGSFWLSSESGANAWFRFVYSGNAQISRAPGDKSYGLSVRCLKD